MNLYVATRKVSIVSIYEGQNEGACMEWSEMVEMEWVFVLYPCFFMTNMYTCVTWAKWLKWLNGTEWLVCEILRVPDCVWRRNDPKMTTWTLFKNSENDYRGNSRTSRSIKFFYRGFNLLNLFIKSFNRLYLLLLLLINSLLLINL